MFDGSLLGIFFIIFTSVVTACICLDMFIKRRYVKKYVKNIPVLPYLPIFGSAHALIRHGMLAAISGWRKQIQAPFFCWIFFEPHYYTNDPMEIKEILTNLNTLEKSVVYRFLKPTLKNSLLTAEVSIWKKNRRVLSRNFAQKTLEMFVPIIDKMCDELVDKIRSGNNGDCTEIIERSNVNIFAETLCRVKLEEVALDMSKFFEFDLYKAIKIVQHYSMRRFLRPWYYPDIIFYNTKMGKEYDKISKELDTTITTVIEDRKKSLKEEKAASACTGTSIFDAMIGENLTNEDMIGEVKLFGGAASETSGVTIGITLNLLAIYPDIQEKVLKEVLEVVGPDGPFQYKDLANLKYTEMVIQETLRIFPPAPYIYRAASMDIDIGGRVFPKGTNFGIDIFNVHRSEKYWENPLEFNPDRFLPSAIEKRPPFTFLPFSLGPRNCIGGRYSMVVMKITLAKIIRSYRVSSNIKSLDEIEAYADITLRAENIHCIFTPRS